MERGFLVHEYELPRIRISVLSHLGLTHVFSCRSLSHDSYDLISAHLVLCSKEDPAIIIGAIRFLPYPLPPIDLRNCKKPSPLGGVPSEVSMIKSFFQYKSIKDSIAKNLESENNGLDLDRDIVKIKFGRVAIDKSYRGRKLGEKMLLESEKWFLDRIKIQVEEKECLIVKGVEFRASSQHFVVGFYQRRVGLQVSSALFFRSRS